MKIKIDPKLKKVEFWATGKEIPKVTGGTIKSMGQETLIHVFKNPKLLVDNAAIRNLESPKRDAIIRLLEFPERIIEYDGVSIAWSDLRYPGVWAPSIDTVLFAKALRPLLTSLKFTRPFNSFLEIGTGSGFLSKYILQKKLEADAPVHHAHLMDINRDALISAMDALEPVQNDTLISYALNLPQKPIKTIGPYDLVICNPPYIPRPRTKAHNPFEGLFLYGEIIRLAPLMLTPSSRLFINFSSISKKDLLPAFKKIFAVKIQTRLKVPLKIPLVTARYSPESRRWMDYLERNKKLIIDPKEKSGYRYWQIIEIAECRLKRPQRQVQ